MPKKVLIANRGEIVIRIARACRKIELIPCGIYSDVAYILLQILRFRLLWITKGVPSMEFVMTWVRQGFIHYICDKLKQGKSIRSLIMTVGKIDTNYV